MNITLGRKQLLPAPLVVRQLHVTADENTRVLQTAVGSTAYSTCLIHGGCREHMTIISTDTIIVLSSYFVRLVHALVSRPAHMTRILTCDSGHLNTCQYYLYL